MLKRMEPTNRDLRDELVRRVEVLLAAFGALAASAWAIPITQKLHALCDQGIVLQSRLLHCVHRCGGEQDKCLARFVSRLSAASATLHV